MKKITVSACVVIAIVFGFLQYGQSHQEFADVYDIYHVRMDDRGLWVFINAVHQNACAGQTLVHFSKKECVAFLKEAGFTSPKELIDMRIVKEDDYGSKFVHKIISFSDRQLKDVNVRVAMYRSYAPNSKNI